MQVAKGHMKKWNTSLFIRKMQLRTIVSSYLTPQRLELIQKEQRKTSADMGAGLTDSHSLLVGILNGVAMLENNEYTSQKKKYLEIGLHVT